MCGLEQLDNVTGRVLDQDLLAARSLDDVVAKPDTGGAQVGDQGGQILGFDTREGWPGWDCVRATMPEAEIGDLIVELRSATAGAGSFTRQFDRMAEVTGRAADQIIAAHRVAA